jgi:ubiquinone/menaquinone biosynthesis C-methylase UbiE
MTEATEFGRLNQWRDTAGFSEAPARDMAARLELRARAEDETAARDQYLQLFGVAPGEHVLDVGCGSGVVTRALAQRVAPSGRVVGVDTSPALLVMARERAEEAGLSGLITLQEGDCRALPFPDATFDATLAVTVLTHVPDVARALTEMVRVTRAGGRVGIFDIDSDAFVIAHPDRELTRRIVAARADYGAVNGWLPRQLPGLLADLGLVDIRVRGFIPFERELGGFYAGSAERAAGMAAQMGSLRAMRRHAGSPHSVLTSPRVASLEASSISLSGGGVRLPDVDCTS